MTDEMILQHARDAFARGNVGEAANLYRSVLQQGGVGQDEAYHVLSIVAHRAGKVELALQLTEAALALSPNMVPALINRAVFLRQVQRRDEALVAARLAAACAPASSEAWHTYSYLCMERRDYTEALPSAEKAVALDPKNPLALVNYASLLMVRGELARAYEIAWQALLLAPNEALMHLTMGQILRSAGYPAKALPCYDMAVQLKPDYVDAKTARASALTIIGAWDDAWEAWEARPYDDERFTSLLRWNGQRVPRLLLHAEQGMGDALQFLRFVPEVRKLVEQLTLQVPKPLQVLVGDLFPDLTVITPDDPVPQVDAHGPLMSVPYVLHLAPDLLPRPVSIQPRKVLAERWRCYLDKGAKVRVGLVWGGNPNHTNDHNRSIVFEEIKPFIRMFSAHLVSLQAGEVRLFTPAGDLAAVDEKLMAVTQLNGEDSVSSMVALMSELDLIISIDSMPAHLAASLSRPTWMMVAFDPDSRWLYEKEDTIWYPDMRLFRQNKPGEWAEVLDLVSQDLRVLISGDVSVLRPRKSKAQCLDEHPCAIALPFKE